MFRDYPDGHRPHPAQAPATLRAMDSKHPTTIWAAISGTRPETSREEGGT